MSEAHVLHQLLTRAKARLRAAHFRPGLLGLLTNPFYFARSGLHQTLSRVTGRVGGRMLDVGCGNKPYAHMFGVSEHIGLELDSPAARAQNRADVFYDGQTFPFPDARFETVFASQVFEHVFNPDRFLAEVYRVLAPHGQLLMTLPFVWDEHEQPHDFARYSSFGIEHLLTQHGFDVQVMLKSGADFSVVLQTWGMYAYKALAPGTRWTKLAAAGVLTLPVNLVGSVVLPWLPKNPDLFLDLVVLASKRPVDA
ncbi:MAG: methylase [Myxococcaceae bacterium]|nr:methylase [Myxococcaceae bacterium]